MDGTASGAPLGQGAGYGIVLGLGFAFALGMVRSSGLAACVSPTAN
jgi:hypothetical protein